MLKLTGRRRWSSLRLFLASGCGEERLVGEVRLMTFRTGVLAGVKLVSIFGMQLVATFLGTFISLDISQNDSGYN
jgi:hypothetical protein